MFFIALCLGKIIVWVMKLRGSTGTALPGLVVERLFPGFLQQARPRLGRVIVITGTNGKTSTQTLLAHTLREFYHTPVLVNQQGANLSRGLVAEICKQFSLFGQNKFAYTVFEIEEATFPKLAKLLRPDFIIVTNFFRDQLDAYGEVNRTKQHVLTAILQTQATVVANADDPQVCELLSTVPNPVVAVGIEHYQNFIAYEPSASAAKIKNISRQLQLPSPTLNQTLGAQATISGHKFSLQLPGYHSFYSFAFVYGLLTEIEPDLTPRLAELAQIVNSCPPAFGRGEVLSNWQLFLVKNPVGFNLTLDLFTQSPTALNLVILINDLIADGKDMSWLWDSMLEKVEGIKINKILLGGSRALDMRLRLKYTGLIPADKMNAYDSYAELIAAASGLSELKVICTYTAMNQFRACLLSNKQAQAIPEKAANSAY